MRCVAPSLGAGGVLSWEPRASRRRVFGRSRCGEGLIEGAIGGGEFANERTLDTGGELRVDASARRSGGGVRTGRGRGQAGAARVTAAAPPAACDDPRVYAVAPALVGVIGLLVAEDSQCCLVIDQFRNLRLIAVLANEEDLDTSPYVALLRLETCVAALGRVRGGVQRPNTQLFRRIGVRAKLAGIGQAVDAESDCSRAKPQFARESVDGVVRRCS